MDMTTALRDLEVAPDILTADERAQLDRKGYLPLAGMLGPAEVAAFADRLAELSAAEGEKAGLEVHQEAGTDRLADLVNKDPMFEICFSHPRLLAAIHHVLGNFRLFSLNSRAAHPGQGHQGLHTDFGEPVQPGDFRVCNSIWLLDDFTPENGATRVVPGSHLSAVDATPEDGRPDASASGRGADSRSRWDGCHLQQPHVARRHPQPNGPAPARHALSVRSS